MEIKHLLEPLKPIERIQISSPTCAINGSQSSSTPSPSPISHIVHPHPNELQYINNFPIFQSTFNHCKPLFQRSTTYSSPLSQRPIQNITTPFLKSGVPDEKYIHAPKLIQQQKCSTIQSKPISTIPKLSDRLKLKKPNTISSVFSIPPPLLTSSEKEKAKCAADQIGNEVSKTLSKKHRGANKETALLVSESLYFLGE
jgi:hypothetical protein